MFAKHGVHVSFQYFSIFQNTSYENELLHYFIQIIFGASAPSVLLVEPCLCDIGFVAICVESHIVMPSAAWHMYWKCENCII